MKSEEDEEDGQEEEADISTFLNSKNRCFLDHRINDLPEGNWRDRLISPRHEFLHLFVQRFDEFRRIFCPPAMIPPQQKYVHLIALRIYDKCKASLILRGGAGKIWNLSSMGSCECNLSF